MRQLIVLVHSPSLGPFTWEPVANELRGGHNRDVLVPSLLHVATSSPPFWHAVVDGVRNAVPDRHAERPLAIVMHSNAGCFAPVIVDGLEQFVETLFFVDATIPSSSGSTALVPTEFLGFLRQKAVDGMLPPWTRWWDEEEVAALFPDQTTRNRVQAEEPRLPLAYYEQPVPAPVGWAARRCVYLKFSRAYDGPASEARRRGWVVAELPGEHLHMLVDPVRTARLIAELA